MTGPNDPRIAGKLALYVLLFLAALVALMIWIGG